MRNIGRKEQATAFGRWLNAMMRARQLTGSDLARAVGVNPSTVSRWRRGATPDPSVLPSLAKALDVDPLRLMVTTGFVSPENARVEPLPMPPAPDPLAEDIYAIRNLSRESKEGLLRIAASLEGLTPDEIKEVVRRIEDGLSPPPREGTVQSQPGERRCAG
jgi:transcriptional regulator with XRE-family HTH domain